MPVALSAQNGGAPKAKIVGDVGSVGSGSEVDVKLVLSTFKINNPNGAILLDFDGTLVKGSPAANPFGRPTVEWLQKDLLTALICEANTQGIPIAILSNGDESLITESLKSSGISVGKEGAGASAEATVTPRIDAVVGNGGTRTNKGLKFDELKAKLNEAFGKDLKLEQDQCVLVDDDPTNVNGSNGFQTIGVRQNEGLTADTIQALKQQIVPNAMPTQSDGSGVISGGGLALTMKLDPIKSGLLARRKRKSGSAQHNPPLAERRGVNRDSKRKNPLSLRTLTPLDNSHNIVQSQVADPDKTPTNSGPEHYGDRTPTPEDIAAGRKTNGLAARRGVALRVETSKPPTPGQTFTFG